MKALALLPLVVLFAGCAAQTEEPIGDDESDVTATNYVEIGDFWKKPEDQDRWFAVKSKIVSEFDNVCGDTFCGGDYSNLTSLGFSCGVSDKRGSIRDCVWTFTGSAEFVNPTTSTLRTSVPSYQCHVKPKATAAQLATLLAAPGPGRAIDRQLPGTTTSLYDVLFDCFQHPIGASPLNPTFVDKPTYVEALDSFTDGAGQDQWLAARSALKAGFDDVCGDTFCEGDYTNIQALRFVCSVTRSTGNLKSCAWLFGGSYADVAPKTGAVTVNAKSWRCNVPVRGTASQLSSVLTAPGEVAPIRRPLPGGTATAYDALLNCL